MKRPPILATLIVVAAVATMVGLGLWQLRRSEWKQGVIAEMTNAAQASPLLIDDGRLPPGFAYRRARLHILCEDQIYDARAGRNPRAQSGWVWRASCRTGAGEPITVLLGWTGEPTYSARWSAPRDAVVTGRLLPSDQKLLRARLYLDEPPRTLARAAAPSPDDLPDNHLAYALQWFFFAGAAALIYLLALRRRDR